MPVQPLSPDRSSRHLHRLALLSALIGVALMAGSLAAQTQAVWNQPVDHYGILDSTVIDAPPHDIETADDFELVGSVSRVIVGGYKCLGCGGGLDVNGAWVRFYDWVDGDPGALQHEVFVPDDDPALVYDPDYPDVLDITLAQPFIASGKHFVSVQLATPGFSGWNWWTAHDGTPLGSTLHQRNRLTGGPWQDHDDDPGLLPRDLAFTLWGEGPPPPTPPVLLFAQYWSFLAGDTPSSATPGPITEAADDFDLVADIHRVRIRGAVTYMGAYPQPTAARVRFYAWQAGVPGVLLYDETVPAGPDFDPNTTSLIDVTLPEDFESTGKGFVSVQLITTNEHDWGWSHANVGDPVLQPALARVDDGPWTATDENGQPTDLCIELFGHDKSPPLQVGVDPCGDWQSVPLDLPADIDHMVGRDLTVVAADDVWIAGTYSLENGQGGPFTQHFDGAQWSMVPTPAPEPYPGAGGVGLSAIAHVASDDVWAAGTQKLQGAGGFIGQQSLVMRWDGSQWSVLPSPISDTGASGVVIRDIEVISADDIWFVGDWVEPFGCDFSLAMHWDGSDFTVVETPCNEVPANNNGFGLESVSAASSDEVWAVGAGGDGDSTINSYVIRWDGSSWEYVPAPQLGIVQRLFAVEALAADDVWAAGSYLDGLGYHAYALHWDGSSWTVHDADDGFATGAGALHAFASDDIYAAGGGLSHWDGTSWSFVEDFDQFTGETLGVSLTGLDAAGPCELWAGGRQVVGGEIVGYSARQVSNKFWALLAADDCDGSAPPDSLNGTSAPVLGGTAGVAIDDPFGATGLAGGATWWLLSLAPAADPTCGDVVAKYGIGFAPGRLRLDVTHPTTVLHGPRPWSGPGQPSLHSLGVPRDPALAGLRVYTQGLIRGPGDAVLTEGLELQLGL